MREVIGKSYGTVVEMVTKDLKRKVSNELDGGAPWSKHLYISKREVNVYSHVIGAISYSRDTNKVTFNCAENVIGELPDRFPITTDCFAGLRRVDVPYRTENMDIINGLIERTIKYSW